MELDRRSLFAGLAAAGLAAAAPAVAQEAPKPRPSLEDRLRKAFQEGRRPIDLTEAGVSGPGWDWLVAEGRRAQVFALGEEHGVAQVPALARELMKALKPAGYSRMALEISAPIAPELDRAARGGLADLEAYYRDAAPGPAFYTMRQEARMLADVRAAFPGAAPLFWGLDYEVSMDRRLIARLKSRVPPAAREPLAAMDAVSKDMWARFETSRDPRLIFCFGADPALVEAVIAAWPSPDPASAEILDTLVNSLRINQHQMSGRYFLANDSRAQFNRANWVRKWRAERAAGRQPRTLFKFGAGHMNRGRSMTEVYDLGSLIAETAVIEGGTSFHLLAIPAPGGKQAVFNPSAWRYETAPADTLGEMGIGFLGDLAFERGSTLVDLRPLRPMMSASVTQTADARLSRIIHGFDAILLIGGATASANL